MPLDLETIPDSAAQGGLLETESSPLTISLNNFVSEFGDELLDSLNRANPPVYTGEARPHRQRALSRLKRQTFPAQAEVIHAVSELLVDRGEPRRNHQHGNGQGAPYRRLEEAQR